MVYVFGPSSVTLGIHPLAHLPLRELVDSLIEQAVVAEQAGFDGATVSEHHRGLAGYAPQPLLVSNWILSETSRIWSGPNPTLLTIRNASLLAEEFMWTAARFPDRFGASVAAGYNPDDFDAAGVPRDRIADRFSEAVERLTVSLTAEGPLVGDQALAAWVDRPPPLLSAVNSKTAAVRAARAGIGVLLNGSDDAAPRATRIMTAFGESGGTGPVMWVRRAFIGSTSASAVAELQRTYATWSADVHGHVSDYVTGSPEHVAQTLAAELRRLDRSACLVVHLYLPGVGPAESLEQIARFGEEVIPLLHQALAD